MNMSELEAGKKRVEGFIAELAKGMKREGSVGSLLWWSTGSFEANADGVPGEVIMPLRIYRGNSWRSIGFARSDVDSSATDPEVLKKYESEIAEILSDI